MIASLQPIRMVEKVCVCVCVEKLFVRFYDIFLFCIFRNSVFLFVTSGQRCAR